MNKNRLANLAQNKDEEESLHHDRFLALSLEGIRVERETAIRLRNEGRINDTVLRRIERELDLSESRLTEPEEE